MGKLDEDIQFVTFKQEIWNRFLTDAADHVRNGTPVHPNHALGVNDTVEHVGQESEKRGQREGGRKELERKKVRKCKLANNEKHILKP